MDNDTFGCLVKLAILASVVALTFHCCDERDNISYKHKNLPGTLIKTTSVGNYAYYFIDTDNHLKTPEYVLTTEAGSHDDMQLKAKLLNHSDEKPAQLPLNVWRSYSNKFQHVRN